MLEDLNGEVLAHGSTLLDVDELQMQERPKLPESHVQPFSSQL
ncbi:Uncharacterised protein [Acinetobacter baumannii]|nr:Uncharacterised protein [Acinetobacter baumannii]